MPREKYNMHQAEKRRVENTNAFEISMVGRCREQGLVCNLVSLATSSVRIFALDVRNPLDSKSAMSRVAGLANDDTISRATSRTVSKSTSKKGKAATGNDTESVVMAPPNAEGGMMMQQGEETVMVLDSMCVEESNACNDFEEIERLTELGIGAAEIKKLREGGFYTVLSIIMATRKTLLNVKGLSEAKVDKIRECASKMVKTDFISGTEAREKRKQVFRITSGSLALDTILGGGIESCSITEAFGEFRCGKTQLSHTLCVTAQLPADMGGANGKVAFIDTENTFRPERIAAIAQRFDLNEDDVLDNIIVARAYTSDHQVELLTHVAARMASDQFALLVVDSATALFRTDFTGRGELADRQQKLNRFMSQLMKIAEQFNVAVFLTNQVMATPDGAAMFVADPKKPIGGHVMAHASTTRLSLRKGRGEQRICKIYDSPLMAELEATFEITEQGIKDASD